MDTVLHICGIAALQIANVLIMYLLARLFTEVLKLPWKVKPFTCRECLAFWLTLAGGIVLAFVVTVPQCTRTHNRLTLCWVAVLLALLNYFYIKSKFKIYE
jgi:hypothetical protein